MVREALVLVRVGADEVGVAWRERKGERVFGEMDRKKEEGKDEYEEGREGGRSNVLIALSLLLRAASLGVGYSTRSSGTINWGKADSTSAC